MLNMYNIFNALNVKVNTISLDKDAYNKYIDDLAMCNISTLSYPKKY